MAALTDGRAGLRARLATCFELSRDGAGEGLRSMEGLRGLAVSLVFVVHYATQVAPWATPGGNATWLLDQLHSIGNAGVDLFFVLSGYLIYGTLLGSNKPFATYLARRVRRIYPAFLAVFALYVVLSYSVLKSASRIPAEPLDAAIYLLQNLLLLPGLLPIEPLIAVAWSLSYEFFYYLVIPAIVYLAALRQRRPMWRILFFAALWAAGLAAGAIWGGPVRLTLFIAGILLFESRQLWPNRAPASLWAGGAALLALLSTAVPMPGSDGQALRSLILGAGFWLLCWNCFAKPGGGLARAFCWTPMRWLGNMSYSYYLIHGLALHAFFLGFRKTGVAASDIWVGVLWMPSFAFTLVVSALLFLAVERPLSLVTARKPVASLARSAGHAHR